MQRGKTPPPQHHPSPFNCARRCDYGHPLSKGRVGRAANSLTLPFESSRLIAGDSHRNDYKTGASPRKDCYLQPPSPHTTHHILSLLWLLPSIIDLLSDALVGLVAMQLPLMECPASHLPSSSCPASPILNCPANMF